VTMLLWLAPLVVPLLAAVLATLRPGRRTSVLLVVAPLPALVLAAVGPCLDPPALPWLLLDVRLALDGIGRVLLGLTATAWLIAGFYGRAEAEQRGGYAAWWLLSLAGNVGVLLADDVLTFYTAFVVMTLAAYVLVVHTRTNAARRAGRAYLVLGVIGETLLLAGLLLAAAQATGLQLAEVASAVAGASQRDLIVGLLVAGFGIKAGVLGLHVWLPLAHPAAPFPASAVLSGAMIKAGLIGWLRLLPIGEVALPSWGALLVGLGLAGTVVAVLLGLTHTAPKVVLAYSSVSQMGFLTLLVGAALSAPAAAALASAAAAAYAWHHGLAKALLFLAVGLLPRAARGWPRTAVLAGVAVAGASLAGTPLSSGAFAKAWTKQSLEVAGLGAWTVTASSLAATGTTLLMLRLFALLRAQPVRRDATPVWRRHAPASRRWCARRGAALGPWLLLAGAVVVATPVLVPPVLPELTVPGRSSLVGDPLWPVLLGLLLAAGAVALSRRAGPAGLAVPTVPAGDLVIVEERLAAWLGRGMVAGARPVAAAADRAASATRDLLHAVRRHAVHLDWLEDRLTRWSTGGAMVALVAAALVVAINGPP
jgi:hydrogenase-4 component B